MKVIKWTNKFSQETGYVQSLSDGHFNNTWEESDAAKFRTQKDADKFLNDIYESGAEGENTFEIVDAVKAPAAEKAPKAPKEEKPAKAAKAAPKTRKTVKSEPVKKAEDKTAKAEPAKQTETKTVSKDTKKKTK